MTLKSMTYSETVSNQLISGYARNSFDRFGDDLCQELLQYLPFRLKVKFECVSKQWKRSVYAKQHALQIEDNQKLSFDGLPVTKLLLFYSIDVTRLIPKLSGISIIERLLSKCTRIRHIVIRSTFSNRKTISYDHLLRLIADNCRGLVSFEYCEDKNNRISEKAWNYLGLKSAKTLKNYVCSTDPFWSFNEFKYKCFLSLCSNLLSINNIKLNDLVINEEIFAPNLSEIKLTNGTDRTDLMDKFVNRYKNKIKAFDSRYNGNDFNSFFAQLSQLTNLEDLSLFMSDINVLLFATNFRIVTSFCSKLQFLSLDIDNSVSSEISYQQLFNSINCCSQLTYLSLYLFEQFTRNDTDSNKLSVKQFENCSKLTHLLITIDIIDDNFFADIDLCFPLLKVIDIQSNKQLTNKTMRHLSRVKLLKVITIRDFTQRLKITDCGVCAVIEKCPHLKSLTLNQVPKRITHKTVVKLIAIARRRPKINFNHRFVTRRILNTKLIDYINAHKTSFPDNLKISS